MELFATAALGALVAHVDAVLPDAAAIGVLSRDELTAGVGHLAALRASVERVTALFAAAIARESGRELGSAGLAQSAGFNTPERLVQQLTGESIARSRRLVEMGALLAEHAEMIPVAGDDEAGAGGDGCGDTDSSDADFGSRWDAPIAAALGAGALGLERADAIRDGLGAPTHDGLTPDWRQAARRLVDDAIRFGSTVEELRRDARRTRARLDEERLAREEAQRYELRSWKRWRRPDGMTQYTLVADPLSAATIDAAVDTALSPRTSGPRFTTAEEAARAVEIEHDPRTTEQFAFDTVLALLRTGIGADNGVVYGSARPEVRVVVTRNDLRRAAAAETARTGNRADTGEPSGRRASVGIAHIDGQPLPVTAQSILASICADGFIPALFDESGRALDVGRAQRLHTDRQRTALAIRDGGCLHPGCARPPSMCEAHHITPWSEGGRTSTDDGVLLCRFHHLLLHNTRSWIDRGDDGVYSWHHTPTGELLELRPKGAAAIQIQEMTSRS
ncbi:HNH endonuclease signature motif containing protein [Gryllotalpicola sp.]|uniref:HNH endonuclease signature motif containing protein n=1 Tax=Gryllotalpicola sp. TaxID=1932787 RepID=UPI00261F2237|nr:HNH endonuclease signature motif containing protein [Gryllotalpicola sp.]